MGNNKFRDKVVLITGASKGIGRTTAFILANKGAKIVLTGRDEKALYDVQSRIVNQGGNAVSFIGDITDWKTCKKLVQFSVDHYNDLNIVINNAGVSMRGNFSNLEFEVIDKVYRTNLIGATYISAIALPFLRKSKGSLVFVSSIAGIRGLPYNSIYCASKMGLRGLAESVRIEEYQNDIHVGLIYVGITQIDKGKTTIGANGNHIPLKDRSSRNIMSQEEVAHAIIKNIQNRKFISTLSSLGKLNLIVQKFIPKLSEFLLIQNTNKIIINGR
ncbi:MAG: SDR family oxidoreductase [Flavobacteriaceae bacterium]|nr:SDR family oxidoreductase [Bacteroidia bacterium]MBT8268379.1 SDR family oxidoreductase [Bacteroidia bacterium]NNL15643.1 SDR family oxidoreductase [Flavobacteriaceae bacterium]